MERTNLLDAYFHWECDKLSSLTAFHCLHSVPKNLFPIVPIRGPKLYSVVIHWHCSVGQLLTWCCICVPSRCCNEKFSDKSSLRLHCKITWKLCRIDWTNVTGNVTFWKLLICNLSPGSTLLSFLSSHSAVNAFFNPSSGLTPRFLFILLATYQLSCIVDISATFFVSFSHEWLHAVFDTAIGGKALLDNPERNQINSHL